MPTEGAEPWCGSNADVTRSRTASTSNRVPIATRQLVRAVGGAVATCTDAPTTFTT